MSVLITSSTNCELSAGVIASFVQRFHGKLMSFEEHERRAHVRYVVAIPSIVQPIDESGQPQQAPFNAVTRDISVGGIGIIHTQSVAAKYLDVTLVPLDDGGIRLLVKVLRCRPLGAYFDIAGEFVTSPD